MQRLSAIPAIIVLVLLAIQTTAQERPMFLIEHNRIPNIRTTVPGWECRNGILNRPAKLAPSETPVLASLCEHEMEAGKRESIGLDIFQVDSRADAALSLAPQRDRRGAAGWSVEKVNIGDEAYLAKYRDGTQYEIRFRYGLNVVVVSSKSLPLVRRVSRETKPQLPLRLSPASDER